MEDTIKQLRELENSTYGLGMPMSQIRRLAGEAANQLEINNMRREYHENEKHSTICAGNQPCCASQTKPLCRFNAVHLMAAFYAGVITAVLLAAAVMSL